CSTSLSLRIILFFSAYLCFAEFYLKIALEVWFVNMQTLIHFSFFPTKKDISGIHFPKDVLSVSSLFHLSANTTHFPSQSAESSSLLPAVLHELRRKIPTLPMRKRSS